MLPPRRRDEAELRRGNGANGVGPRIAAAHRVPTAILAGVIVLKAGALVGIRAALPPPNREDELNKRHRFQMRVRSLEDSHKKRSKEIFANIRKSKSNPEPFVQQAAHILNETYEKQLKKLRQDDSMMKTTFDRQQNILRSHHDQRQRETSEMVNQVSLYL